MNDYVSFEIVVSMNQGINDDLHNAVEGKGTPSETYRL